MASGKRKETPGNYRIDVRDFGPIARASVEMRPLTVFIGPSNTGKSYLAMLLYALHRCLEVRGRMDGHRDDPFLNRMNWIHGPLSDAEQDLPAQKALMDWFSSASANESPDRLPTELLKLAHANLERPRWLDTTLGHEIRRCFGVGDLRPLMRRGSGRKPSVVLSGPADARSPSVEIRDSDPARQVEVARYELKLAAEIELTGNVPLDLLSRSIAQSVENEKPLSEVLDGWQDEFGASIRFTHIMEHTIHRLLGSVCRRAHYLPADRTGVMHSHQVVVSALVQSASMVGLRPSANVPMLSGVLTDFLYQLINVGRRGRRRGDDLAKQFEERLLAGAVRVETSEANYPSFLYRPSGWGEDLPLMRTSSMVSELAPVVLYLRHVVQRGDVLIVEEPEAHLHPAMQAAFARELAWLVRVGVRVVLTTHSEWLLEQIGNLVRLSALPVRRRSGIEGADVALEPSQVGAWLFKPNQRPRGSVVQEVELDPQTGLFPTDFDDVSRALYNDGAEIFNRLQDE